MGDIVSNEYFLKTIFKLFDFNNILQITQSENTDFNYKDKNEQLQLFYKTAKKIYFYSRYLLNRYNSQKWKEFVGMKKPQFRYPSLMYNQWNIIFETLMKINEKDINDFRNGEGSEFNLPMEKNFYIPKFINYEFNAWEKHKDIIEEGIIYTYIDNSLYYTTFGVVEGNLVGVNNLFEDEYYNYFNNTIINYEIETYKTYPKDYIGFYPVIFSEDFQVAAIRNTYDEFLNIGKKILDTIHAKVGLLTFKEWIEKHPAPQQFLAQVAQKKKLIEEENRRIEEERQNIIKAEILRKKLNDIIIHLMQNPQDVIELWDHFNEKLNNPQQNQNREDKEDELMGGKRNKHKNKKHRNKKRKTHKGGFMYEKTKNKYGVAKRYRKTKSKTKRTTRRSTRRSTRRLTRRSTRRLTRR